MTWATVSSYERDQQLPSERDVREHAAILLAIKQSNPDAASSAMREHLSAELALPGE